MDLCSNHCFFISAQILPHLPLCLRRIYRESFKKSACFWRLWWITMAKFPFLAKLKKLFWENARDWWLLNLWLHDWLLEAFLSCPPRCFIRSRVLSFSVSCRVFFNLFSAVIKGVVVAEQCACTVRVVDGIIRVYYLFSNGMKLLPSDHKVVQRNATPVRKNKMLR